MIAMWLINRQRPLLLTEDPELEKIFEYLNPSAKLPSADTIKNTIMRLYDQGKNELKVKILF